jgi:hypothetical protein
MAEKPSEYEYVVIRREDWNSWLERDSPPTLPTSIEETVLVVNRSDTINTDNPIANLIEVLERGDEPEAELVDKAKDWNIQIAKSCKSILEQSDRFFNHGNASIARLQDDLDTLKGGVRKLVRNMKGFSTLDSIAQLQALVGIKELEHEVCPTCQCWDYNNLIDSD